jgi:hypothetical protein
MCRKKAQPKGEPMAYKNFNVAGATTKVTINTKMVVAIFDEFGGTTRILLNGGHEIEVNEDHDTVEQFLLEGDTEDRHA